MTDINDYKEYNVTGYAHGIITYAKNVREARNIFRRSYPHEKIFYSKLAGKIKPKHPGQYITISGLTFLQILSYGCWETWTEPVDKTEITYPEFIKLFEGGEEETPYRPMSEFPQKVEGEHFSKTVLVFDKDLEDFDLGFYNFDTQKWDVLGDFQMNLICWRHIEKPKYEDVQEYQTFLTD